MDTAQYEAFRHFADSWGLLYMVAIFAAVVIIVLLPGAKQKAAQAARIPLDDTDPVERQP